MWTANLDKVIKNGGNVIATVTFTSSDTGETLVQDIPGNDLTSDNLATFVGNRIQALEVRDLALQTLIVGPINPPEKTVEQIAQLDSINALVTQLVSASPVA